MIALDTNVLVYAHRRDSAFHAAAADTVRALAQGRAAWGLPWPCLHEFYAIVTHRRIYSPPSTSAEAIAQIEAWLASPSVVVLSESAKYWESLRGLLVAGKVTGPMVHDARIAAICLSHGVRELWSADRDFSRFTALRTRNPVAG